MDSVLRLRLILPADVDLPAVHYQAFEFGHQIDSGCKRLVMIYGDINY